MRQFHFPETRIPVFQVTMKKHLAIRSIGLLFLFTLALHGLVSQLHAQAGGKSPPKLAPETLRRINAAIPSTTVAKPRQPRRILVVWRCEGFFHEDGIAGCNHALAEMGRKTGAYSADFSGDYSIFEPANLAKYDVVVLNNTTQLKLPEIGKQALLEFVQKGKGLVGIHAATDSFYDWPEGAAMLGGLFDGHPWGAGGTWAFKLDEPAHPLNRAWGGQGFKLQDEIYQFKAPYTRADRRVLVSLDLSDPATGGVEKGIKRTDRDFAVAWIKRCGEGRVFYCSLGHAANVFQHANVLRFYLDGIRFALGDLEANASPK
jgi:type 1 glutamine amidotransferase